MDGLSLELTNSCNRRCRHCLRNQADPSEFFSLELVRDILAQAKPLGITHLSLTGGEITLHPHLEKVMELGLDQGFKLSLVTNGHRFKERLLTLLVAAKLRDQGEVCFSLDGSQEEVHDALRGPGSFREVIEAVALCHLKEIPFGLKTVIIRLNQGDLLQVALLGASLGARTHGFLHPFPTPRLIQEGLLPPPRELQELIAWISGSLAKALRSKIIIEGYGPRTPLFSCANLLQDVHLDYQGNLVLCCNLSHVVREEGRKSVWGKEWLGNLKEISLKEGLIRHFYAAAALMEARLRDSDTLNDLTYIPCYWCLRHFGKIEWLRSHPESPWAAGLL